jgi:hypothetical protein
MGNGDRYYRQVTASVLNHYIEFEDGLVPGEAGDYFEPRIIDYRIDVERAVKAELGHQGFDVLLYIHKDGMTHAEALQMAGVYEKHPARHVIDLEKRLGKALVRKNLLDFTLYLRR